jgi:hypothetical protein
VRQVIGVDVRREQSRGRGVGRGGDRSLMIRDYDAMHTQSNNPSHGLIRPICPCALESVGMHACTRRLCLLVVVACLSCIES